MTFLNDAMARTIMENYVNILVNTVHMCVYYTEQKAAAI